MKTTVVKTLKYLVFLAIGVLMLYTLTKQFDLKQIYDTAKSFNITIVFLSILFSLLSNVSRAIRWNYLLGSINHKVPFWNAFFAVKVMYAGNMVFPRLGEVLRCTLLQRSDEIPVTKAIGTVIVERLADAFGLLLFMGIVVATQFSSVVEFMNTQPEGEGQGGVSLKLILMLIGGILFLVLGYVFRNKLKSVYEKVLEGVMTIREMGLKKQIYFVLHTLFIYAMWLLMNYIFFMVYEPTSHIDILKAIAVFVASGVAMILPVPAGVGPWHWAVIATLMFYGVGKEEAGTIAFIMHGVTYSFLFVAGIISLILFFLLNRKKI